MPITAYLFKASPDDIDFLNSFKEATKLFPGLKLNNFDPTMLLKLEAILTGRDIFEISKEGYQVIKQTSTGDRFIATSAKLVSSIVNLIPGRKKVILKEWCECPEMIISHYSIDKAEKVIDWMIEALKDRKSLGLPLIICIKT